MDDHAVEAVRSKTDSSLVRAVRAVADGDADVVVSAGNTGAMLAASLLHIRRLPGVHRPGIAVVIPTKRGPSVLIDAGANADARPEHLVQFAHMGSVFAEEILGVAASGGAAAVDRRGGREGQPADDRGARAPPRRPTSASAGTSKGAALLEGDADVVVADGFTGNVALKTLEGTVRSLLDALRDRARSRPLRGKLGGAADPARLRGGSASASIPRRTAAATCSDSTVSSSSRTARAPASRSRTPSVSAARGVEHRVVERLQERLSSRRVSIGALHDPDGREVRFQGWQLRVRRSSSRSKAR